MNILTLISVFSIVSLFASGQSVDFEKGNFSGSITKTTVSDSTYHFDFQLTNISSDTIYLLKSVNSFIKEYKSNSNILWIELIFPPTGDIYMCKKCTFKLYELKPSDLLELKLIRTSNTNINEVRIQLDQILVDRIEDAKVKKHLLKSIKTGQPELDFKYYFDSAGQPKNEFAYRLNF
jgi:hypothetical protein